MKVNGNDPVFEISVPVSDDGGFVIEHKSNIPIRLELASRMLPCLVEVSANEQIMTNTADLSRVALAYADILIKTHNETCGGE